MGEITKARRASYYAVIFTSIRNYVDEGYSETAACLMELAKKQKGFLGIESVRKGNFGITGSYWDSLETIEKWRTHIEHLDAIKKGRESGINGAILEECMSNEKMNSRTKATKG